MNTELLKTLLAVQTTSWHEQPMVSWIVDYVMHNIKGCTVTVDPHRNVFVHRGSAKYSPCVAAHIDTVQPHRQNISIVEDQGRLIGLQNSQKFGEGLCRVGIGADDKAGVFVCLDLLKRFKNIRVAFFAGEEVGCYGASHAAPAFFDGLAYMIEFDCPSRNLLSYTASGVRLFANRGEFIQTALPVLQKHGTTLWQRHPYSDIMAVRQRFPISCLNLSCGYYNWHMADEFISLRDLELGLEQGYALVKALDHVRYECPVDLSGDTDAPLIKVGSLHVPEPV